MGLFDMFKGDTGEVTPHFAFATSLIYMIGADGKVENEEVGQLLAVLGGEESGGAIGVGANNQQLLDRAFKYYQKNSVDTFLSEMTPLLTDAQKMCILTNIIDSSLSDGEAAPEEQELFAKFLQAFNIPEERFQPFFDVIALKNDRAVFTKTDHPSNEPGYTVQLKF
ncbi:MAG: TerB family tellurite resistance protein [Candidatus Parabeggiatoa sp. nov. 2]|nr:MAG: Tellurite resistance protein TerB [Beggiatoa sp. 4572_84]RKZ58173.1 MAG: TerB family tellurite resistance protein [Gammaproteobacteria bacterium]HEC85660.1 TerB family tellurite resistance protein [Thioploca sp.]